ncbi:MAG: TIGR00266 family protein [Candidatus Methanomethyliaceae archaeon]|nr:TIGR00266 family protein [Candidatus Methanomethyliaceae archaeon]MDW7970663.1 TIGR00266 family protein [Nitrososphaerota archaeon]
MEYEIKFRPSYSMLVVRLNPGEAIIGEAGAMTYMTPNIAVRTKAREGILGSIGLKILGGQSFWINEYTAVNGSGEIGLVSAPLGDIERLTLSEDKGYIIRRESYIASSPSIDLDIRWEGFTKGLFGQGLFMIKAKGKGDLFINTFGAIDRHLLKEGETLIVDNFHLVAFSSTCNYRVEKFGGLKETLLSGEGLVVRIEGPGEVLIQTKSIREFIEWLWSFIEPMIRSRAR